MKIIYKTASLLIIVLTICFWIGLTSHKQKTTQKETTIMATSRLYTEKNILEELDFAFNGVPGKFFPKGGGNIILGNYIRINPAQKLMLSYPSYYSENINYKTLKYESINCKENCN